MRSGIAYVLSRLMVFAVVVYVGITLCFVIPRLSPINPVETVLSRFLAYLDYQDPREVEYLRNALMEIYGLKGSLLEQYIGFWRRVIVGDFGPSLANFPTPVSKIIGNSLPWTIGLLSTCTLFSWFITNIIGGFAGYFSDRKWAKLLSAFAVIVTPIPYYIMALLLVILFSYVIPIFPMMGGTSMGIKVSLSLEFILSVLYHSILPALSLIIVSYGGQFITMRALVINTKAEDYVQFAESLGIPKRIIASKYVIRNCLLPRVTGLALSVGEIFTGALAMEVIFAYPGIGTLLQNAVLNGDYNLIMGITTYSIISVAFATLLLDLLYPLVDPRIRYK